MRSILRRALGALGKLRRRRIALVAILVLVAAVAGYGACTLLGTSSQAALEENQRVIPVRMGVLTKEISVDGGIVFPNKETVAFASRGFVDEILVSEGEEVKEGQPLARLDAESIAAAAPGRCPGRAGPAEGAGRSRRCRESNATARRTQAGGDERRRRFSGRAARTEHSARPSDSHARTGKERGVGRQ